MPAGKLSVTQPRLARLILKNLGRSPVRTALISLAVVVLVAMVTLIWTVVFFLDQTMTERSKDLKLIIDPAITYIAYVDGEPAAVALATPNLNEAIRDLQGKILPLGFAKLIYRLKVEGTKTARLAILGIKKKFRHQRKYAGLSIYLYSKMNEAGKQAGYRWGELSWTLEDNGPVNVGIKLMGGKVYKKYRMYQADL